MKPDLEESYHQESITANRIKSLRLLWTEHFYHPTDIYHVNIFLLSVKQAGMKNADNSLLTQKNGLIKIT